MSLEPRVSFEELLDSSDYISIHVPLRPETRHLFGRDEFRRMKSTAYLINTARGPIIHETELVSALKDGIIAGAGLDVYEFEPEMVRGLAGLDNVVCTAHTASATRSSRADMALKAACNLLNMIKGEPAPDCINKEVYSG
jgi:glyoxylate reductase